MKILLLLISFFLTAFGQPAWIPRCGMVTAAFGFALFWRAMLYYSRPRDRFLLSLIWFACVQGIQLSWMATFDYMGPLILLLYLFLILGMGVQFGILSFFFNEHVGWRRALAIAGSWVLFEWLRLYFLCGFTWNLVGIALTDSAYSLQFASVWGIFGLSFWVILSNLAALNVLLEKSKKGMAIWAGLTAFPYLFGFMQQTIVESRVPISGHLKVALVQTAVFPEQRDFSLDSPDDYIPAHLQLERIFAVLDLEKKVDLVVFPEGGLPFSAHQGGYDLALVQKYFDQTFWPPLQAPYASFRKGRWKVSNAFLVQALANRMNAHVIAGLDDADATGKYNAAFHFQPKNTPYYRYEKRVLVPVGEYVPLVHWPVVARFVAKQFGIYSSFDAGHKVQIFNAQFPIGVSICLEETFSGLTRDLRLHGAELFVNLTNDVWFPGSKLPQQHFDHGRVRAAENGVCLLRACNTGVTGAVDCFGKPLEQLPVSEDQSSVLYMTLPIRSYSTLYTWWGDRAILGFSFVAVASYFLFRKKKLP